MMKAQKILGRCGAPILFLFGAACANTIPTPDMAFNANTPQALLVTTGELQQVRGNLSDYKFRRVNLESREFVGETVTIGFGFAKDRSGDELREASGERIKNRTLFAVKAVEPGDYVLVGQFEVSSGTPYSEMGSVCYSDRAAVFRLEAGKIQIVDAYKGPLLSYNATSAKRVRPDRIEPDFDKLRQGYPNVQGEANVVSPIAMIQWPIEKGKFFGAGLLQRCSEAATFKVLAKSSKQGLID